MGELPRYKVNRSGHGIMNPIIFALRIVMEGHRDQKNASSASNTFRFADCVPRWALRCKDRTIGLTKCGLCMVCNTRDPNSFIRIGGKDMTKPQRDDGMGGKRLAARIFLRYGWYSYLKTFTSLL